MTRGTFPKYCVIFVICFLNWHFPANQAIALNDQFQAIHHAVLRGDLPAVKEMLDIDQDVNAASRVYEVTPLHMAAQIGTVEMARILIRRGAKLDTQDSGGNTPLHYAALAGRPEMLELLLKNGADSRIRSISGYTPLHSVIHSAPDWDAPNSHYPEAARILLENGASLEIKNVGGATPYSLAAWNRFGIRRKVWKVIEAFQAGRKPI